MSLDLENNMNDFINCIDIEADANESIVMVIGVGGGGGNALKHMYKHGIHGVMFAVCNTDAQALRNNPVPHKMQLGQDLTRGRGAGNRPEKGRAAALESKEEIKNLLINNKVEMLFITAGMGGGTGTGAAPVIAEIARELEILSVAIVTLPFRSEGPTRLSQAADGIKEMRKHVDSLLVIDNENISTMYGDLSFSVAFGKSDNILTTAAKGIAEIIAKELSVNVDFEDVKETMNNSGVAVMGFATVLINDDANIISKLTEEAFESPLLNKNNISGAKKILIKVTWKDVELNMNIVSGIIDHVQAAAGSEANIIWGAGYDESVEDGHASIVVIATGFTNIEIDGSVLLPETKSNIVEYSKIIDHKPVQIITSSIPQQIPSPINIVLLDDEIEPKKSDITPDNSDFIVYNKNRNTEQIPQPKESIELGSSNNNNLKYVSLDDPIIPKIEKTQEDTEFELKTVNTHKEIFTKKSTSEDKESYNQSKVGSISSIKEYTIEELEQLPAYIRRKYILKDK